MKKEHKIYFFKNQKDYEKVLTKDNVINVIGTKGSGKTTLSKIFKNHLIVSTDELLEIGENKFSNNTEITEIKEILKTKYKKIEDNQNFINCYNDIVNYATSKNKNLLIEGNAIDNIKPITKLKGKVIVKRTPIFKCFIRTIKRDFNNEYFMTEERKKHGKLAPVIRLFKVFKRRIKIFRQYKNIQKLIEELEKYE